MVTPLGYAVYPQGVHFTGPALRLQQSKNRPSNTLDLESARRRHAARTGS